MSSAWTTVGDEYTFERALGDSEYAFFRNSSTGLGDMFLHLALRANRGTMRRERVRTAWAIIRATHPLLMCSVRVGGDDLRDTRMRFVPPRDVQAVLDDADRALYYRTASKDELIDGCLNGPRVLSNEMLSFLILAQENTHSDEYHLVLSAPHFIGDGSSVHQSTHDLLALLSSHKSDEGLREDLKTLLERTSVDWATHLPPSLESLLPTPSSRLASATHALSHLLTSQRSIGAHTLPRAQTGPQHTRLIEHSFSEADTQAIVRRCKAEGVSVNGLVAAVCATRWARLGVRARGDDEKLPLMLYSAINLRPLLPRQPSSYWYLALTYYTLSLPSFPARTPWPRARSVKRQTARAVNSPFLLGRAGKVAAERAAPPRNPTSEMTAPQLPPHARAPGEPAPSAALLGLSLMGNLDRLYTRESYASGPSSAADHPPPSITLHTVTTASRQRAGGLLVLTHTLGGRLWVHLCWDEMGFGGGEITQWWEGVVAEVGKARE